MSDELIVRINEWKELLHQREYSARANGAFDVAKHLRQQQSDLALFAALAKRKTPTYYCAACRYIGFDTDAYESAGECCPNCKHADGIFECSDGPCVLPAAQDVKREAVADKRDVLLAALTADAHEAKRVSLQRFHALQEIAEIDVSHPKVTVGVLVDLAKQAIEDNPTGDHDFGPAMLAASQDDARDAELIAMLDRCRKYLAVATAVNSLPAERRLLADVIAVLAAKKEG